jgi:hypothetical protein
VTATSSICVKKAGLFRAVCLAALICLCGAATAAPPGKISADDYVEILQLYAEFNTSLDLGKL